MVSVVAMFVLPSYVPSTVSADAHTPTANNGGIYHGRFEALTKKAAGELIIELARRGDCVSATIEPKPPSTEPA